MWRHYIRWIRVVDLFTFSQGTAATGSRNKQGGRATLVWGAALSSGLAVLWCGRAVFEVPHVILRMWTVQRARARQPESLLTYSLEAAGRQQDFKYGRIHTNSAKPWVRSRFLCLFAREISWLHIPFNVTEVTFPHAILKAIRAGGGRVWERD